MRTPTIRREQVAGMNMHHKQYSLKHWLNGLERAGYVSAAFWGGPPGFHLDRIHYQDCKTIKQELQNRGLSCVCFTAPALLPGNQFSTDKEHAEDTFRYFVNGLKASAELGSPLMIANSGYGLRGKSREDAWRRTEEMLFRIAEEGQKLGVTLTMESLRPQETNLCATLADTVRMLRDVNHPNLKAMIDTTAMAVSGETIWDWFSTLGGEIINTHFIDANPCGHLSWGDGALPLEDMLCCLNQYGYTGPLCLEITEASYFFDPDEADLQTMRILSHYFN